ncbi:MAG: FliH/SctL family protein [Syntrophobacteraceae bacterium]
MSKIIKAHENQVILPFSFSEIESVAERSGFRTQTTEGEVKSDDVDLHGDLEHTIRQQLLDSERKAEETEREAYEKGYAQGIKDGTEYGEKRMAVVKEQIEHCLAGLQALPEKVLKDYRDWFIAACIAVSRKVVRNELDTRPELIIQTIDGLLHEAEENQTLTIHLHPKDIELLNKHTDFCDMTQGSERSFAMKPDPQIERGGCRMENDIQFIDATLETRFTLIKEALLHHEPSPEDFSS